MKCGKCKKDGVTNEHVRECYGVSPRHQQQDTGWKAKEGLEQLEKRKLMPRRQRSCPHGMEDPDWCSRCKRKPDMPSNTFDYLSVNRGHRPRERR